MVVAIAVLAIAATAGTILVELASDHAGPDPGLQASLHAWLILPYVRWGLFAWYRQPESRFGPLMIAAGFVTLLSSISAANSNLFSTLGTAFDLVPFAAFMHVFLAFPTGALRSRGERLLVGATYAVASLNVVGLMLGGFDPGNAFAVIEAPEAAADLLKVQLVAAALLFLIGFVIMVTRRGVAGRPLPTPVKVLVNFFSVAFVMGAALLLSLALEIPLDAFLTVQRTMFVVVGLAPFVFLLAILDARLARSAVGDLLVELRSEPGPPTCASRCPVRCATPRSAWPTGYRNTTRGPIRTGGRSPCPAPVTPAPSPGSTATVDNWRPSSTTPRSTMSRSCSRRSARRPGSHSRTGACRLSSRRSCRSSRARASE